MLNAHFMDNEFIPQDFDERFMCSLIGRFRRDGKFHQEFNKLGFQRLRDKNGKVMWIKGDIPQTLDQYLSLLKNIEAQLYEGHYYFMEDPTQLKDFIKTLIETTQDLSVQEYLTQHNRAKNDEALAVAKASFEEVLQFDMLFLKTNFLDLNQKSREEKEMPLLSKDINSCVKKNYLQDTHTLCMRLLSIAKNEIQNKKMGIVPSMELSQLLSNYTLINQLLRESTLLPQDKTVVEWAMELEASGLNPRGAIRNKDREAIIAIMEMDLEIIIADSIKNQDEASVELSCMCRSLVSTLKNGSYGQELHEKNGVQALNDFMRYFKMGILAGPLKAKIDTGNAHQIRLAALGDYAHYLKLIVDQPLQPEVKVNYYLLQADKDFDSNKMNQAYLHYSLAAWIIRCKVDDKPSCTEAAALGKAGKVERILAERKIDEFMGPRLMPRPIKKHQRAATSRQPKKEPPSEEAKQRAEESQRDLISLLDNEQEKLEVKKKKQEKKSARQQEAKKEAALKREADAAVKREADAAAKREAKAAAAKREADAAAKREADAAAKREADAAAKREADAALKREADAAAKREADAALKREADAAAKREADAAAKREAEAAARAQEEKESTLSDFQPAAFSRVFSQDIIDLLVQLNLEAEGMVKEGSLEKPHLEIVGSFVLYWAMLMLKIKITRAPQDLDLFIYAKDFSYQESHLVIPKLKNLGFIERQSNPYLGYVKLEKPTLFPIEVTLAFKEYRRSINPNFLTRHVLQFDHVRGSISYNAGNKQLQKELIADLRNGLFRVDLKAVMRPSLNVVNLFSRLLKFSFDYHDSFLLDPNTTYLILNDLKTIKRYFKSRLDKITLAKHNIDPDRSKNICYLEIVSLIEKGYFTKKEARPIIMGFVNVLLEEIYSECLIPRDMRNQLNNKAAQITSALQNLYVESKPNTNKQKGGLVADFYCFLKQEVLKVFPEEVKYKISRDSSVLVPPQITKKILHDVDSPPVLMPQEPWIFPAPVYNFGISPLRNNNNRSGSPPVLDLTPIFLQQILHNSP